MAKEFLPLNHAGYHILLALADGERHGYGIMSDVEEISGGATRFGPGTLYTSIKRLLTSGLIEESEKRPDPKLDDERRRYYRLSGLGRKVLSAESERLSTLLRYARSHRIVKAI